MHPALFIGRAPEQVSEFLAQEIEPLLAQNREILGEKAQLRV